MVGARRYSGQLMTWLLLFDFAYFGNCDAWLPNLSASTVMNFEPKCNGWINNASSDGDRSKCFLAYKMHNETHIKLGQNTFIHFSPWPKILLSTSDFLRGKIYTHTHIHTHRHETAHIRHKAFSLSQCHCVAQAAVGYVFHIFPVERAISFFFDKHFWILFILNSVYVYCVLCAHMCVCVSQHAHHSPGIE